MFSMVYSLYMFVCSLKGRVEQAIHDVFVPKKVDEKVQNAVKEIHSKKGAISSKDGTSHS